MTETRAGRTHRVAGMLAEEGPLFRRRWFGAGRAREDGPAIAEFAESGPQLPEGGGDLAGLSARTAVGDHAGQSRKRFCAACEGMFLRLDDKEGAGRAERKAGVFRPLPHRRELVLQIVVAESVQEHQVLALAIVRAADQGDIA